MYARFSRSPSLSIQVSMEVRTVATLQLRPFQPAFMQSHANPPLAVYDVSQCDAVIDYVWQCPEQVFQARGPTTRRYASASCQP